MCPGSHIELKCVKKNVITVSSVSVRNSNFNLGSDVNLMCSNKTWNETMFVIWKIKLLNTHKDCKIGFASDGQSDDSCKDGKSLRNTSGDQSYLHIPNVSEDDEGIYKCESVYRGGQENYEINVAIRGKSAKRSFFIRQFGGFFLNE